MTEVCHSLTIVFGQVPKSSEEVVVCSWIKTQETREQPHRTAVTQHPAKCILTSNTCVRGCPRAHIFGPFLVTDSAMICELDVSRLANVSQSDWPRSFPIMQAPSQLQRYNDQSDLSCCKSCRTEPRKYRFLECALAAYWKPFLHSRLRPDQMYPRPTLFFTSPSLLTRLCHAEASYVTTRPGVAAGLW